MKLRNLMVELLAATGSAMAGDLDRKLLSDDTILAVDAKTGKTLWKRVFAGQGYYLPPTKRGGYGVTPAVWQGTVYWLGSAGRLYAVNAATGEPRWQVEVEPLFAQQKADAEKSRQIGKRGFRIGEMLSSLVVAGVPATDATIQKAAAADSALAGRLAMYADTDKETKDVSEGYREFWKNIDADAAASGPAQEVW